MYAFLATVFTVLTVPALWIGLAVVKAFNLPFELFCLPLLVCAALSMWCVSKFDDVAR